MSADQTPKCTSCGEQVSAEVPEYYIEIECFRLIREREDKIPRRGSKEYHETMEKLAPEVRRAYFQSPEMYNNGHLWCPVCGSRMI